MIAFGKYVRSALPNRSVRWHSGREDGMRITTVTLVSVCSAVSGCAAELPPASEGEPVGGGKADVGLSVPALLSCSTEPSDPARTLRATLDNSGQLPLLTVTEGALFDENTTGEPVPPPVTLFATHPTGGVQDDHEVSLVFTGFGYMSLTGNGQVYTGTATFLDHVEVAMTCWSSEFVPHHRYRDDDGTCVSAEGEPGWNALPIAMVRETRSGECTELAGTSLSQYDLGYPILRGWDLRGARLSDAELYFALLQDADLRGAELSGLRFGSANVSGTIDAYTVVHSRCTQVAEDRVDCWQ
jgi:hypothetical protein